MRIIENKKLTDEEMAELSKKLPINEYFEAIKLYSGLITEKTDGSIFEMFFYGLDEDIKRKVKDYFLEKSKLTDEINKKEIGERFIRNCNSIFKVYTLDEIADRLTNELPREDLDRFSYRLSRCTSHGYDLCMNLLEKEKVGPLIK